MSSLSPDAAAPGTHVIAPAAPGGSDAWPASADVVAPEARLELDRIRRRWAELPLDRAESRMPLLRDLLADLAHRSARPCADFPPSDAGREPADVGDPHEVALHVVGNPHEVVVPDLGPAVVVDQVTVLVWDAYANRRGDGIPELLTAARRALG